VEARKMKEGIASVVDVVSSSQVKPEITGVYFSFNKEAIKLVATDSFSWRKNNYSETRI